MGLLELRFSKINVDLNSAVPFCAGLWLCLGDVQRGHAVSPFICINTLLDV